MFYLPALLKCVLIKELDPVLYIVGCSASHSGYSMYNLLIGYVTDRLAGLKVGWMDGIDGWLDRIESASALHGSSVFHLI